MGFGVSEKRTEREMDSLLLHISTPRFETLTTARSVSTLVISKRYDIYKVVGKSECISLLCFINDQKEFNQFLDSLDTF